MRDSSSLAAQQYSIESRDQIFVKGCGFLSFVKNKFFKKKWKFLCKYIQKPFDRAKQSATDALKTISKRNIKKKTEETMGYLIGSKIADKITSTLLPQWSD